MPADRSRFSAGERRGAETPRARKAWADYVALGPGRSLEKLQERYQTDPKAAPTLRLTTLKVWSVDFGWQDRLREITNAEVVEATAREAQRVREIMETGFAAPYERVTVLKELADYLLADLRTEERRWVRDVKGIGQGDNWESVEVFRFNAAELEQLRGLLDDIAKETGGRPKTVKVDIEAKVRLLASKLGIDPEAAVAEAERILQEGNRAPAS